ncbi:DUF4041 domain-containing protein [Paenibacillus nicotianae]|uniref:DUF4041 domain-containing protein n=1 Tax=Paenibacillus nicotianae TaxID=1526551 RepID=A0ABW4UUG3_9BACL
MFVSKKRYNDALYKINELQEANELKDTQLLKNEEMIIYLKKEFKLITQIYRDTKSELNKTIKSANTIEELKSQEEIIKSDILYESIKLSDLKENIVSIEKKLKTIDTEIIKKSKFTIPDLQNSIKELEFQEINIKSNISHENIKLSSLKKEALSIEKKLKILDNEIRDKNNEKMDIELDLKISIEELKSQEKMLKSIIVCDSLTVDSLKENSNSIERKIEILNNELISKSNLKIKLNLDIENITIKKEHLENSIEDLLEKHDKDKILLNKEIEKISNNKYLLASTLERKLLQELKQNVILYEKTINNLNVELEKLDKKLINKNIEYEEFKELKKSLILLREEKDLQEVAFYKSIFPFNTTEKFKDELFENNLKQKEMIKLKKVINSEIDWTVNGSVREGRKMTDLNIKSMIRSYNTECDNAISNLKYSTFNSTVTRINKSRDAINKLNEKNVLSISESYHKLKLKELRLVYELKIFEKNEKETLRIFREEERERKKVEQETKEKLLELSLHEKQVEKQLVDLNKEFIQTNGENVSLLNKIKKLEDSLALVLKKREEIHQRHLIGKSGYVYIISNIGTLGENIYKIGMTRRLEPSDRIKELSGAAVPFEYDVHAMILTDDAPRLENHLHSVFHSNRVNLINNRKEFFNVTLDKIKKEVFSIIGKNVVFEDMPQALQYFETLSIKNGIYNEVQIPDFLFNSNSQIVL